MSGGAGRVPVPLLVPKGPWAAAGSLPPPGASPVGPGKRSPAVSGISPWSSARCCRRLQAGAAEGLPNPRLCSVFVGSGEAAVPAIKIWRGWPASSIRCGVTEQLTEESLKRPLPAGGRGAPAAAPGNRHLFGAVEKPAGTEGRILQFSAKREAGSCWKKSLLCTAFGVVSRVLRNWFTPMLNFSSLS